MILLTGNKGFLGSVLAKKLGDYRGYDVQDGFDVNDVHMLGEAMREVDAVVHLAGLVGEDLCSKRPDDAYEVNTYGAWRVMDIAFNYGVRTLILASTCSVYGGCGDKWLDESSTPNPWGVYSTSKFMAECYVSWFGATVLRFGSLYGGESRTDSLPEVMLREAQRKHVIRVRDVDSWRPLTHVEDAADAVVHVLGCERPPKILNVVGENIRKGDLAKLVQKQFWDRKKIDVRVDGTREKGRSYRVNSNRIQHSGFSFKWKVKRWLDEKLQDSVVAASA